MRVMWDEDDLAFELDFPDMMDMVYKWEGEPVLLVDPEMNRDFGDMILDVASQDADTATKNNVVILSEVLSLSKGIAKNQILALTPRHYQTPTLALIRRKA